ncbi:hypothetical protein ACLB2K_039920 [Fragaria x ananassa]
MGGVAQTLINPHARSHIPDVRLISQQISYEIKLVASGGGSIIKSTSHYHTKGEVEIKEEHVKAGKERAAGLFKIIENHLLAHPEEYN